jgi:hypothetical protein
MVQDSGCKLQAGYAQQDREAHCHRYQATEATQAIAIAFKGAGILSGGSSATPPSQPAQIVTIFTVVATHQLAHRCTASTDHYRFPHCRVLF